MFTSSKVWRSALSLMTSSTKMILLLVMTCSQKPSSTGAIGKYECGYEVRKVIFMRIRWEDKLGSFTIQQSTLDVYLPQQFEEHNSTNGDALVYHRVLKKLEYVVVQLRLPVRREVTVKSSSDERGIGFAQH